MPWNPSQKEIAAVSLLNGEQRYHYFVKKVADAGEVWGLWDNGWAMAGDYTGKRLLAVWPHSAFAIACGKGTWSKHVPKAITIDAWLDTWIPGMKRDGTSLAVFLVSGEQGTVVDPERCEIDLRQELEQYE
ncbi:MAG: DUF2750 domain-containing protein [Flavobacteriales bacterium]|nr:DUF2750 domain-containing protein [Flavobacteriales bacterium]